MTPTTLTAKNTQLGSTSICDYIELISSLLILRMATDTTSNSITFALTSTLIAQSHRTRVGRRETPGVVGSPSSSAFVSNASTFSFH